MRQVMLLAILAAVVLFSSQPASAGEWIACAGENQTCKVPGTRMVRYGVDDQWSMKKATDRIQCSNDIFGDPAPGKSKACYYEARPQPDKDWRHDNDRRYDNDRSARWIRCADEGEYCRFRGDRDVRYGRGDRWNYKSSKDGIACNNDEFGDPAPGKGKACYYQDALRPDRDDGRHGRYARWARCADEGEYCRFRGFRDVRYGVGDRWNYKSSKDGISCNNDEFGDPAPGKMKECFIKVD